MASLPECSGMEFNNIEKFIIAGGDVMKSVVYWGSPRQAHLEANETLPAKLDLIIDRLKIRDRVKDELVAIKIHSGNNIGYSTVHPLFVRKVVQAVKDGGGRPFITDVDWDVAGAETRGYTRETLGCPILPSAGLHENYHTSYPFEYKNIKEWKLAGMIKDASFLINFAHVKGHPSCGFGSAFKNLALGCMTGEARAITIPTTSTNTGSQISVPMRRHARRSKKPARSVRSSMTRNTRRLPSLRACNQCGRC
jgi:hypothetical protein